MSRLEWVTRLRSVNPLFWSPGFALFRAASAARFWQNSPSFGTRYRTNRRSLVPHRLCLTSHLRFLPLSNPQPAFYVRACRAISHIALSWSDLGLRILEAKIETNRHFFDKCW